MVLLEETPSQAVLLAVRTGPPFKIAGEIMTKGPVLGYEPDPSLAGNHLASAQSLTENRTSMPSHPISGRTARKALSATIDQTNAQHDAIIKIAGAVKAHQEVLKRDLKGRLRWLLRGK